MAFAGTGWATEQCTHSSGNTYVCTSNTTFPGFSGTTGTLKPWPITVDNGSGGSIPGNVTKVTLTMTGVSVTNLNHAALLVTSPSASEKFNFLAGACPGGTVTFDDTATTVFPVGGCSGDTSGTFRPANDFAGCNTFPGFGTIVSADSAGGGFQDGLCSQPAGTATFANHFNGLNGTGLNGTWDLYGASQDSAVQSGTITSWTLTITTTGAGTTTSTTLNAPLPNPSFTSGTGSSVTFAGQVTPATSGTVTIHDVTTNTDLTPTGTVDGSGNYSISAVIATEGSHSLVAVYAGNGTFAGSQSGPVTQTVNNHATQNGNSMCNAPSAPLSGAISILSGNGVTGTASNPYPSEIILGGSEPTLSGIIQNLTITLTDISANSMGEWAMMLVAPSGKALEFMADVDGAAAASNVTLTLDDTAATSLGLSDHPATGTFRPSDCVNTCNNTPFVYPSPAPASFDFAAPRGSATLTSEFAGGGVDGTWKLFITNMGAGTTGSIAGGWCLNFVMQASGTPTTTAVTSSVNPALTGAAVMFTATVTASGNTVNSGTVTFSDAGTALASNVAVVNGTASFTTSALIEGTHQIIAQYSGTNTGTIFGPSSGKIDERINNASTVAVSGPVYTFCNAGGITLPAPPNAFGPAGPYPSNIFVTNLPGTVKGLTVTLKQVHVNVPNIINSLLVGPGGANLDFFSGEGGSAGPVGPFDLTFDDTAATTLNTSSLTGGSFKPTSASSANTYPACPSNATDCQSPAVGPPAPGTPYAFAQPAATKILGNANAAGVFGGTASATVNGGGTYSLYQVITAEEGNEGSESAWCLNFTQNLPDISLTSVAMTHAPSIFTRGQSASYTVTASNLGPGPTGAAPATTNLTITTALPPGLTYSGFSSADPGWNCSVNSGTVSCNNSNSIAALSASAVTVNVNVSASTASSITIPAAITPGSGGDSNTSNNSTSTGAIAVAGTILHINKTHTDPFTQGQPGAYNITVSNLGADGTNTPGNPGATVGTVQVTDSMPGGLTVTNVTGSGWTCASPPAVSCTLNSSLAVGSTTNAIVVTLTVANTVLGPVTNMAVLTATTDQIGTADSTCASNVSCHNDPTNITQVPTQMSSNLNTTPQSAAINTAFVVPLSVTVKDAGNNPVPGVSVTFTAPGSTATGAFATGGGCTATGCIVTTNSSGVATANTFTANGQVGSYSVTATSGSLTPVNFSLSNTDTPATVTGVSSTTANGTYGAGAPISIIVSFNKPVNVNGTPQLALNSGGTASYASGSATSTLTFSYVVASGQNANPLDEASTAALSVNGGTIQNPSGQAATLTLPAPGGPNSLGVNKSIVIDTTPATILSVSSSTANGSYGVGAVIAINIVFNKAVTVGGTPALALNSGGTASYVSGSPGSTLAFSYTVAAGQNSSHLDYTSTAALTLNGGSIQSAGANPATLTLPSPGGAGSLSGSTSIVIDTTPPTVTNVSSTNANGTYGAGSPILITVAFNKPMVVTGTPLLALNSAGTASYSSVSGSNTLTFGYTVAAGQNANPLDEASSAALSLNGGSIKDTSGNVAILTLPAPGSAG